MKFEEFKEEIFNNLENLPEDWRKGQKIFNYVDFAYGDLARHIQFEHGVDCFYRDDLIDDFLKEVYNDLYC